MAFPNVGLSSRTRVSSLKSVAKAAISGKTATCHLTQIFAVGFVSMLACVVLYMYRVISALHEEQLYLRQQVHQMSSHIEGDGSGSSIPSSHLTTSMGYVGDTNPDVDKRKLGFMATVGQAATSGCYELVDNSGWSKDMSGDNCNGNPCPDCFIVPTTLQQDGTLTIIGCSSAKWLRGQTRTGIWSYTFINPSTTWNFGVKDGTTATVHWMSPLSFNTAYCDTDSNDRLLWPTTRLPTLTVDDSLTMSAGDFDASTSPGTFKTSTGVNTLGGNTAIAGANTFSTGTGNVELDGDTTVGGTFTVSTVGASGASVLNGPLTVNADVEIDGIFAQTGAHTFTTGSGDVSLGGHVTVAPNKDVDMSGTGTFTTGTGDVTINGNFAQADTAPAALTFSTSGGAVTLRGNTKVLEGKSFEVGSTGTNGNTGASTFYGPVTIGDNSNTKSVPVTVYGSITQNDDADGSLSTFSTGGGAHTFNGDITVLAAKNLIMGAPSTGGAGNGMFSTGTGSVNLRGNVQIDAAKTFDSGTGTVTLKGDTIVENPRSFTVGDDSCIISPDSAVTCATQLFGKVKIGEPGPTNAHETPLQVTGDVTFQDMDTTSTAKTFHVAYGHTSSQIKLGANTETSAGKSFTVGTSSSSGVSTFNGDIVIPSPHKINYEGDDLNCQAPTNTATTVCGHYPR